LERFEETLGFLETYLSQTTFVAADHLTIADFTIMTSLMSAKVCCGHDLSKYPKIVAYYAKCETEIKGFHEINDAGMEEFRQFMEEALKKAT
jgi:glutathione S-transferase